jgi:putative peptidoglycan lipid II flippase
MLAAVLNAGERFAVAALVPLVTPLLGIVAVVIMDAAGGWPLAWAALAGAVIEVAALSGLLVLAGHHLSLRWPRFDQPELRETLRQWWPVVGSMAFQTMTGVVDQTMCAHMLPGSVSALSYAQRIIVLPMGLATLAVGTSMLATLANISGDDTGRVFWRTLDWWQRRMFWATTALAVVLMVGSRPLVAVLFEHGNFQAEDTVLVARILLVMAGMIPFYVTGIIGVRALNALRDNRSILRIAGTNLVLNVLGNLVLAPLLGVIGVALTTVMVYSLSFLQIQFALRSCRRHIAHRTLPM